MMWSKEPTSKLKEIALYSLKGHNLGHVVLSKGTKVDKANVKSISKIHLKTARDVH